MPEQAAIAVIGAGVIGSAVAHALAREGRPVLLIDRADPGMGGASFGNVGHIATELVQPLPSLSLLFGFWRQLFAFGGPLDIPWAHLPRFRPWAARFARAAFARAANTASFKPLVSAAMRAFEAQIGETGGRDLLRRNGHYEIWLGAAAAERATLQLRAVRQQGTRAEIASPDEVQRAARGAAAPAAAGLWFPDTGHVADPLKVVQAFAHAAIDRGARFERHAVRAVQRRGAALEIVAPERTFCVAAIVICAGPWSAPLLAPFGVHAPLEGARGYHIELAGHAPFIDAPVLYADHHLVVTPMAGRLRLSSDIEFADLDAAADVRKPARLRRKAAMLGYACARDGASWMGARPVLPDYLPGIGRCPDAPVFYAIGHQHLGLTLSSITAQLLANLVQGRPSPIDLRPFDLARFGPPQRP